MIKKLFILNKYIFFLPLVWVLFIISKALYFPTSMFLYYTFCVTLILLLYNYYRKNSQYAHIILTIGISILVIGYLININNFPGAIFAILIGYALIIIGEIFRIARGKIKLQDFLFEGITSLLFILTYFLKDIKPYIFIGAYINIIFHLIYTNRNKLN